MLGEVRMRRRDAQAAEADLMTVLRDTHPPTARAAWTGFLCKLAVVCVPGALLVRFVDGGVLESALPGIAVLLGIPAALIAVFLLATMSPDSFGRAMATTDRRTDPVRAAAAHALLKRKCKAAVPDLVEALHDPSYDVSNTAYDALLAILPRFTGRDYGALPSDVIPAVCRLTRTDETELALAALSALEAAGDGRACPPVERLATAKRETDVTRRARAVIPVLLERLRVERASSTLLRPAEHSSTLLVPSGAPTEELLRPLASTGAADPASMLRPADP
jgi:hypothetical protein